MNRKEVRGALGERYVASMLSKYGFKNIEFSPDKYDQDKDITAEYLDESVTVEVKVQPLFYAVTSFSLPESQIRKCSDVNFFFVIITKTADYHDNTWTKKVYLVKRDFAKSWNAKNQRWVVPLLQSKVKFVCNVEDEAYDEICKHYSGNY